MISKSRFDDQLHDIGLITNGHHGVLSISIKDPGANLFTDPVVDYNPDNQPLTLMAESAINGHSGVNTVGYRDYRGVLVVGAWLWDVDLGFGIASEIDAAEVYQSLYASREVLVISTAISVALLAIFFMLLEIKNRHIEASKNYLRTVLDNIVDGILIVDDSGRIREVNPSAAKTFGYRLTELVGSNLSVLVPSKYRKLHAEQIKTIRNGLRLRLIN